MGRVALLMVYSSFLGNTMSVQARGGTVRIFLGRFSEEGDLVWFPLGVVMTIANSHGTNGYDFYYVNWIIIRLEVYFPSIPTPSWFNPLPASFNYILFVSQAFLPHCSGILSAKLVQAFFLFHPATSFSYCTCTLLGDPSYTQGVLFSAAKKICWLSHLNHQICYWIKLGSFAHASDSQSLGHQSFAEREFYCQALSKETGCK